MSQYIVNNKDEENEEVVHCLDGNTPLQEVQGLRLVDATMPCKLNYIASEPGLYRIVLSNEHSWYNSKQLLFRYCVLSPTHEQHQINIQEEQKVNDWKFGEAKVGPRKDMKHHLFEGLSQQPQNILPTQTNKEMNEEFGMLIDFENPSSN